MLLRVMLMSAKRLLRSLAKMSIVDLKLSLVAFWAHSALTHSSRLEVSSKAFSTLMQSRLWMETPLPRVTKPMISSPGRGLQHLANLTKQPSSPSTMTPLEAFCFLGF